MSPERMAISRFAPYAPLALDNFGFKLGEYGILLNTPKSNLTGNVGTSPYSGVSGQPADGLLSASAHRIFTIAEGSIVSCLADGADHIFARAVTDLGGTLEVIVPAARYRERLPEDAQPEYDQLLALATAVRQLPYTESDPEAHMAAMRGYALALGDLHRA
jgi:hypothetical protein